MLIDLLQAHPVLQADDVNGGSIPLRTVTLLKLQHQLGAVSHGQSRPNAWRF